MIIAISGKAGSGKSTVAKLLASKLRLRHYSIGDLMREMAKEKERQMLEYCKLDTYAMYVMWKQFVELK